MIPLVTSPTLLRSLHRFVLVGLVGMLGVMITLQVQNHYSSFTAISDSLRAQYLKQQQELVQREVQRVVERVRYRRGTLRELAAAETARRVDDAVVMIRNMLARDAVDTPEAKTRQRILQALAAIRFDGGTGYFFVTDSHGVLLMHPDQPQWVGRSIINLVDPAGNSFGSELHRLADENGHGSLEYRYTKPGQQGDDFLKVSHVEKLPELGWIVGTGVYLDDLEATEKAALLAEIQQMRYGRNGYLFVDDWNGRVLAHGGQPELVGRNIWDYEDSRGVKVVQRLIAAARTEHGDYIHYRWRKPDSGEERPKVSFAMGIHDWQWMIGSGVYTDDVEARILQLRRTLENRILWDIAVSLGGGAAVGLLLILWIRRIYSALDRDLQQFRVFFGEAASSGRLMDPSRLRFREFRRQAEHVNDMLRDKLSAEGELREHQTHLEHLVSERTHDLEEKTHELEHIASTDPLTDLLNRRSFSELALDQLRELEQRNKTCCLVLLDIDHFKQINDHYGHATGDRILQTVAERLKNHLRQIDLFCRWGGEEFTLLLPDTDPEQALQVCQRMRHSLSGSPVGPVERITASFGYTCLQPGDTLDTLVKRADTAMYAAKQAGRDRIQSL